MAAGIVFRSVRDPSVEHVFCQGADEYAEAAAKQRAGYGWLDISTGEFFRERPRRAANVRRTPRVSAPAPNQQPATRDYLADWRL